MFINAHWLGALFLAVGASTGAAAIALILAITGGQVRESLTRLMRFTSIALVIQLVFLALFIATVAGTGTAGIRRALAQLLAGPDSPLFWVGAVVVGVLAPLALQFGGAVREPKPRMVALVSALVLVGGFIVKSVIITSGQRVLM
jgi:formate-dependent nitrite reductase membrane component NrfD